MYGHHGGALGYGAPRTTEIQPQARWFWANRAHEDLLAQASKKCLPLLSGQKLEEPRHRIQQHLRIFVFQIGSG